MPLVEKIDYHILGSKTRTLMLRSIFCTLLVLSSLQAFSQNYSPLKKGLSWKYELTTGGTIFTEIINDKHIINGKEFFVFQRTYSRGEKQLVYTRIDSLGNEVQYNPDTGNESISIPNEIKLNKTWANEDGTWIHQISSLHERLGTPSETYEDCLVIESVKIISKNKRIKYKLYFIENLGFVGLKVNGKLNLYLLESSAKLQSK